MSCQKNNDKKMEQNEASTISLTKRGQLGEIVYDNETHKPLGIRFQKYFRLGADEGSLEKYKGDKFVEVPLMENLVEGVAYSFCNPYAPYENYIIPIDIENLSEKNGIVYEEDLKRRPIDKQTGKQVGVLEWFRSYNTILMHGKKAKERQLNASDINSLLSFFYNCCREEAEQQEELKQNKEITPEQITMNTGGTFYLFTRKAEDEKPAETVALLSLADDYALYEDDDYLKQLEAIKEQCKEKGLETVTFAMPCKKDDHWTMRFGKYNVQQEGEVVQFITYTYDNHKDVYGYESVDCVAEIAVNGYDEFLSKHRDHISIPMREGEGFNLNEDEKDKNEGKEGRDEIRDDDEHSKEEDSNDLVLTLNGEQYYVCAVTKPTHNLFSRMWNWWQGNSSTDELKYKKIKIKDFDNIRSNPEKITDLEGYGIRGIVLREFTEQYVEVDGESLKSVVMPSETYSKTERNEELENINSEQYEGMTETGFGIIIGNGKGLFANSFIDVLARQKAEEEARKRQRRKREKEKRKRKEREKRKKKERQRRKLKKVFQK